MNRPAVASYRPAPGVRRIPCARRAFSLIEMLVALTITATLLTASLAALDASFKAYKHTTDSVSTHVVSRIVMGRLTAMIRTGDEFGPFPIDVLNPADNPLDSTFIEFTAFNDEVSGLRRIVRIERRDASSPERGPFELWYHQEDFLNGVSQSTSQSPLITNLQSINFRLEYDVGPRLVRATIDMIVEPDDDQAGKIHTTLESDKLRLVASVVPRRLDDSE
ncbi:MAG TPA: prepilin-type N-terminal cleavage/methylation domain-containing protein [Phycisphaerales bacterium]|nr:prepilin-type N-terminal cleavage/methylation domain-containing protein [Phycisphaerales bacterium]